MGSGRPVIGLTTYLERAQQGVWDVRAAFLPHVYLDAVTAVGGAGVLLTPQIEPDAAAEAVLDGLDGLVLTGGLDVDPALYGAEPHPETDEPRRDRDAWELALLTGARRRGIPVFGICRGLQLGNVAFGGTLHQHLPDVLGTDRYQLGGGVFALNTATVSAGSRLAAVVGAGDIAVRSYHHQGIDRVGDGLTVTARSDDGLPQAIEAADGSWFVAVQWHPEEDAADRRLFAALVAEARRFRAGR
ncbi:gamma-glutamyl-gamma-aminobutyrate hydrolase family protein [Microbacterium hominis]|uniref:gamma-glutamyl-gamma-aminobutyrate hydrolase family protein n=1 Tax=Microbacterium hominis TaxID=162426 RepID=UPI0019649A83|nr:gamma-glutamyl-gamma-aminobutyrate hydrolase family protein [Microbacterium hominis]QRY42183.1 gamma-glutamyl-gamma-aminobutyrate hydrolase family protein [Microbacterium hominis]